MKSIFSLQDDRYEFYDLDANPGEDAPIDDDSLIMAFDTLTGDYLEMEDRNQYSTEQLDSSQMEPDQLDDLKAIGYLQGLESESQEYEEPRPQNNEAQGDEAQIHEAQNNEDWEESEKTTAMKGFLFNILLALMLAACSKDAPRVDQRLIILGFDGMDPVLARQWMDDGSLPNFRKLAAKGEFHPLPTSNPPQSPVAWSDFATGTGPGEHGIYDFLRRDRDTLLPAFSISKSIPPQEFLSLFGMELPLDSGRDHQSPHRHPLLERC